MRSFFILLCLVRLTISSFLDAMKKKIINSNPKKVRNKNESFKFHSHAFMICFYVCTEMLNAINEWNIVKNCQTLFSINIFLLIPDFLRTMIFDCDWQSEIVFFRKRIARVFKPFSMHRRKKLIKSIYFSNPLSILAFSTKTTKFR